jgi:hypothetical protein
MAVLILDGVTFTVDIVQLAMNCPKFKNLKLFPYHVNSRIKSDSFHVFVDALNGSAPAITAQNKSDLLLLCKEFGFSSLSSRILDFRTQSSVVSDELPIRTAMIESEDAEHNGSHCLPEHEISCLRRELSDLRAVNSRQAIELLHFAEANAAQRDENSADLQKQGTLRARFVRLAREVRLQGEQLAELLQDQTEHEQYLSELREEQSRLAQELASVQKSELVPLQKVSGHGVSVIGCFRCCLWCLALTGLAFFLLVLIGMWKGAVKELQ